MIRQRHNTPQGRANIIYKKKTNIEKYLESQVLCKMAKQHIK